MKTYTKDSNAPPQARGTPLECRNAGMRECVNEERLETVISNPVFSGEKSVNAEAENIRFLPDFDSYRDGMTPMHDPIRQSLSGRIGRESEPTECENEERQTGVVISISPKARRGEISPNKQISLPIAIGIEMTTIPDLLSGGCKPVVTAFEPPGKRLAATFFALNEIAVTGNNPGLFTTNPGYLVAIFRRQAFVF